MYRTNDVSVEVNESILTAELFTEQANINFQKVHQIYKQLEERKVDFEKHPYKGMKDQYGEMKNVIQKVANMTSTLKGKAEALSTSMQGKNKVSSTDPAYSRIREYRSYMENISGEFNRLGTRLNGLADGFTKNVNQAGIHQVSVSDLHSKVEEGLAQIKKKSIKAKRTIKWARTMLDRFSEKEKGEKKQRLDKMESLLGEIDGEMKSFSPLVEKFKNEVGDNDKVLVLRGMASHQILSSLEDHIGKVNNLAALFNFEATKFQKE